MALVTGSSRGIGRTIAMRLAENKVDLVVNYFRHRQEAENTAEAIRSKGVRCLAVKANVADDSSIKEMFEQIRYEYGRLDILVSNAASGILKPALELTEKHWQWTMDINARALLPLVQNAVPLMHDGGRIIAVSSLGAIRAIANYAAVGASKAALESLVRHLAVELASRGINVNVISAGAVDTEALKHFPNREAILESARERTPAGRLTTPEDVANVVLLLCSDFASMIHGQTIVVDGGYSILA